MPLTWRHNRWLLAWSGFVSIFAYALGYTAFGVMESEIEAHFGIGKALVAAFYGIFSFGFLVSVLAGGKLEQAFGSRLLLALGPFGTVSGYLAFSHTHSLSVAFGGMFVAGFAGGIIEIGANTSMGVTFPENRTFALNLLHTFFGIGATIGPSFTAYLMAVLGSWGAVYWLVAVLMGAASLLAFAAAPRMVAKEQPLGQRMAWSDILRSGCFWVFALGVSCYMGTEVSLNIWSPAYLETDLGFTKARAAATLSSFWLLMAIGRLVCTSLAHWFNGRTILLVQTTGGTLFLAAFFLLPTSAMAPITFAATGLFLSGIFATLMALAADHFPHGIAEVTTAMLIAVGIGNLLFPWLIGLIGAKAGLSVGLLFTLGFALILTGFATAIFLRCRTVKS